MPRATSRSCRAPAGRAEASISRPRSVQAASSRRTATSRLLSQLSRPWSSRRRRSGRGEPSRARVASDICGSRARRPQPPAKPTTSTGPSRSTVTRAGEAIAVTVYVEAPQAGSLRRRRGGTHAPDARPRPRSRHRGVPAAGDHRRRPTRRRRPRTPWPCRSTPRSQARRSTGTSSASSPSTSAPASTRASGSVPTPPSPTPAASATTSWPRSRRSRCRTCAGRADASRTSTTGARASARTGPRPSTPTGAASSSRTRFGTHEFMDFVDQIGSEAFLSVNVGSGTPQEAAEWLEYLTTDQPTALAKERAANGHPAPYKIAYLGLGNESWDCGGNMTRGVLHAADDDLQPLRPQLQSRAARRRARCCGSPSVPAAARRGGRTGRRRS